MNPAHLIFFLALVGGVIKCSVVCEDGYMYCYGGCVPTRSDDECTDAVHGKCYGCRNWELKNGVCTWNCSKFGDLCMACNEIECTQCPTEIDNGMCGSRKVFFFEEAMGQTWGHMGRQWSYPKQCNQIEEYSADTEDACEDYNVLTEIKWTKQRCHYTWKDEKYECAKCPGKPDRFFGDQLGCESCRFYYDTDTELCLKEYKCDKDPGRVPPQFCKKCGFGFNYERQSCETDQCKKYTSLKNERDCSNCYEWGSHWDKATNKCVACSTVDPNAIRCQGGLITECKPAFAVSHYYDYESRSQVEKSFCRRDFDYYLKYCMLRLGTTYCLSCLQGDVKGFKTNCHECPDIVFDSL